MPASRGPSRAVPPRRRRSSLGPFAFLLFVAALVGGLWFVAKPAAEQAVVAYVAEHDTLLRQDIVRAFVAEREERVLDGLVLAPCDRSAIWLGKVIGVVAFLVAAEVVALPAYALFFRPVGWELVAAVALADLGLAAVGTLLAAMAAAGRARELLLPVLFLPLVIPIVVGGVGASATDDPGRYLAFLGLYDAVFAILSWASFEYVVTE